MEKGFLVSTVSASAGGEGGGEKPAINSPWICGRQGDSCGTKFIPVNSFIFVFFSCSKVVRVAFMTKIIHIGNGGEGEIRAETMSEIHHHQDDSHIILTYMCGFVNSTG